jgi:hypothetical protein
LTGRVIFDKRRGEEMEGGGREREREKEEGGGLKDKTDRGELLKIKVLRH